MRSFGYLVKVGRGKLPVVAEFYFDRRQFRRRVQSLGCKSVRRVEAWCYIGEQAVLAIDARKSASAALCNAIHEAAHLADWSTNHYKKRPCERMAQIVDGVIELMIADTFKVAWKCPSR